MELAYLMAMTALLWGGYPVLMKFVEISPAWAAALLTMGAVPMGALGLLSKPALPSSKAAILTSIAGLMLGGGMYFFSKLLMWDGLEIGRIFPICAAAATVITAIGGMVFLGEPISITKVVGLAAIGLGIYLLH